MIEEEYRRLLSDRFNATYHKEGVLSIENAIEGAIDVMHHVRNNEAIERMMKQPLLWQRFKNWIYGDPALSRKNLEPKECYIPPPYEPVSDFPPCV